MQSTSLLCHQRFGTELIRTSCNQTTPHSVIAQEITAPQGDITASYPKVFNGLGTLQDNFHIHLKPYATPFAIHTCTPCNMPLPMRPKVKAELERMESLGVISKDSEPIPWCAGMVAVPKPDGSVCTCVDLRPLNANVLREVHPLLTVATFSHSCQAPMFSANWTPTADFGKSPWRGITPEIRSA